MKPSTDGMDGLATSASTSSTVRSISMAMLIARLIVQNVLPSFASGLVTMTRLAGDAGLGVGDVREDVPLDAPEALAHRRASAARA